MIGQNKENMVLAVNVILNMGGGTILKEDGETLFRLPLPLAGKMSDLPMDRLIEETSFLVSLLEERGYAHSDPYFTMLFMSATLLPDLRLTAQGIYSTQNQADPLSGHTVVGFPASLCFPSIWIESAIFQW